MYLSIMQLSTLPDTDRFPEHYLPDHCFRSSPIDRQRTDQQADSVNRSDAQDQTASLLFRTSQLLSGDLADEQDSRPLTIDIHRIDSSDIPGKDSSLSSFEPLSEADFPQAEELPWAEWNELQKS
ncbi:hypothetical protein ACMFWY_02285 [Roseiconus sp. JC912]